jgi:hypothetical protein
MDTRPGKTDRRTWTPLGFEADEADFNITLLPMEPQRRRSVPIAYEDRLVVADALGTTIKRTSMASWRCPLAWRRAGYGTGQVL